MTLRQIIEQEDLRIRNHETTLHPESGLIGALFSVVSEPLLEYTYGSLPPHAVGGVHEAAATSLADCCSVCDAFIAWRKAGIVAVLSVPYVLDTLSAWVEVESNKQLTYHQCLANLLDAALLDLYFSTPADAADDHGWRRRGAKREELKALRAVAIREWREV